MAGCGWMYCVCDCNKEVGDEGIVYCTLLLERYVDIYIRVNYTAIQGKSFGGRQRP